MGIIDEANGLETLGRVSIVRSNGAVSVAMPSEEHGDCQPLIEAEANPAHLFVKRHFGTICWLRNP
ncbi:hypothetical protein [Bradyrhizobium sp. CB1015]|uniref:hypothetical protein n=1 Tax=Bradyrhizobium sp. CB1015 TaxID=2976822 RepID=UPI0021AA08D4|nr:hypothetical protein [Bradyrhizobium sp. CB1015]UWU89981.1 hypothetical protein N2604_26285 [Bradyrhizobium sp. CB1015]